MWQLAALGAGYTMQSYGADQREQAMRAALEAYMAGLGVLNKDQSAQDRGLTADLRQISQSYQHDVSDLVNVYNPDARAASYGQGKAAGLSGIKQALGTVNAQNPIAGVARPGANAAFTQAAGDANARAQNRTDLLAAATATTEGLNQMGQRESALSSIFAQRGMENANRMQDAMNIYQMGNALRQKAMQQAAGQHGLEMQDAQNKGSAWMLAGGLLSGAGQLGSSYWGQSNAQSDWQNNGLRQQQLNYPVSG